MLCRLKTLPLRPVLAAWLAFGATAGAAECALDQASYVEERSGAVIQFRPIDQVEDGLSVTAKFVLTLPNVSPVLAGEVGWNAGRYSRPDGAVRWPCVLSKSGDSDPCWLWMGGVYAIGDETATWIEEADMAAPNVLLLAGFGRSLLMDEAFVTANPQSYAYDVFTLTDCVRG